MFAAPNSIQTSGHINMSGATTYTGAMPPAERLTVQREANDLHAVLSKCHALLDLLTSAPTPQSSDHNAVMMPLGSAVSASRGEVVRLAERLDSLVQAVGQI